MFTGLVETTGTLLRRERRGPGYRMRLKTTLGAAPKAPGAAAAEPLALGESIAVNGVCLTVVEDHGDGFSVDMSAETVEKTTLGEVASGGPVNLERALRLADRLGGHLVSGHVDGIAKVTELVTVGEAWRVTFSAPRELLPYIAEKGSVALDGVSLTVNAVRDPHFEVMLIPHTWQVTTLHQLAVGRPVNLEVDLLARYVVRYVTAGGPGAGSPTTPGANFEAALRRAGYK